MNRIKERLLKTATIITLIFLLAPINYAHASSDFDVTNSYNVSYEKGDDFITITQSVEFQVYTQGYYIPSGTEQTFFIQDYGSGDTKSERQFKTKSLKVMTQYGSDLFYQKSTASDGIELSVPITLNIDYRNSYKIIVQYKTHDLVNVNGNIVNLYLPGLSKNTDFEERSNGLTTRYIYDATITTDNSLPAPSYYQPSTITKDKKSDKTVYTIPQEDRIGHTSWLQLGSSQYYYFKIVQKTPKTDTIIPQNVSKIVPAISANVFKLALPREFDENQQKVYFKSIAPSPELIERDDEGNLIATFSVPANEDSQIVIEGYISLFNSKNNDSQLINDISIFDYKESTKDGFSTYLQSDQYWETDSSAVKSAATNLLKGQTNLLDLIRKDYSYVVDKFSYDPGKINAGNPRVGAEAALNGADTICMEYSDTLIAILRAQGIAARAALGYGNDPSGAENRISNDKPLKQTIGHQWVQIWVPEYGWLSVDPTWGESERTYIGSDLDHILWYTVGDNEQAVTDTVAYISDPTNSEGLGDHEVYIQALNDSNSNEITSYDTSDTLIEKYHGDNLTGVSLALQTSPLGRAIIFLIPITAVTFFTIFLSLTLKALRKKLLKK